jgi:hypothetical protein
MITDTIYCYYVEMGKQGELDLVKLWEEMWQKQGWKTIVLGRNEVIKDPRWPQMVRKASEMPCVNGLTFEEINFERWLAFASISGAVSDYDVLPIKPFPPRDFGGFFCGNPEGGPGFIVGSQANFSRIAEDILNYVPCAEDAYEGRPHVSDMLILQHSKARYDKVEINHAPHWHPAWRDYPLCHFTNARLTLGNGTKEVAIKSILKTL